LIESATLTLVAALGVVVVCLLVGRFVVADFRRGWRCPHLDVRCTHGDEIFARGGSRRICRSCGRALDGPLPEICSSTGRSHARTG
jgi:hypothetical protein